MKGLTKTALVIANIGAINWGLLALSPKAELVQYLQISWLITMVYAIIAMCGIWGLVKVFK